MVGRAGAIAEASRCDCVGPCPLCDDSDEVECSCDPLYERIYLFNQARIPSRHHNSTRRSFKHRSAQSSAGMAAISQWMKDFAPGEENRGLVLFGRVGRGKTHLMVAAVRELVFRRGISARFVEFRELLANIKTRYSVGDSSLPVLEPLYSCDLLALDDLGKGLSTKFDHNALDELISRRYNAMLPTIATTNWSPGDPDDTPSALRLSEPLLVERIGLSAYSRLSESTDFLEVLGEDYRANFRHQRFRP